jgi:hypothetical protein
MFKYDLVELFLISGMIFQVMFRLEDVTVSCICNRFEQFGLLCRHILFVLRMCDITEFPKQYILRRWTREAVPNISARDIVRQKDCSEKDWDVDAVVRDIKFSTEYVINKLVSDMDQLCIFRDHVKQYMSKADDFHVTAPPPTRKEKFAAVVGMSQSSTATIRVPIGTRFKGCGSRKRLKSKREQAISQAAKKQRKCKKCKSCGHDRRNCEHFNPTSGKNSECASSSGVDTVQE